MIFSKAGFSKEIAADWLGLEYFAVVNADAFSFDFFLLNNFDPKDLIDHFFQQSLMFLAIYDTFSPVHSTKSGQLANCWDLGTKNQSPKAR